MFVNIPRLLLCRQVFSFSFSFSARKSHFISLVSIFVLREGDFLPTFLFNVQGIKLEVNSYSNALMTLIDRFVFFVIFFNFPYVNIR